MKTSGKQRKKQASPFTVKDLLKWNHSNVIPVVSSSVVVIMIRHCGCRQEEESGQIQVLYNSAGNLINIEIVPLMIIIKMLYDFLSMLHLLLSISLLSINC